MVYADRIPDGQLCFNTWKLLNFLNYLGFICCKIVACIIITQISVIEFINDSYYHRLQRKCALIY